MDIVKLTLPVYNWLFKWHKEYREDLTTLIRTCEDVRAYITNHMGKAPFKEEERRYVSQGINTIRNLLIKLRLPYGSIADARTEQAILDSINSTLKLISPKR